MEPRSVCGKSPESKGDQRVEVAYRVNLFGVRESGAAGVETTFPLVSSETSSTTSRELE